MSHVREKEVTLIAAQQLRGTTVDITITDSAGDTITPGANDRVRAIIGRLDQLGGTADAPTGHELLVESGTPTANGSSFSINSPSSGTHRLRLDAEDLVFDPGTYTLLVELFDRADSSEWKDVDEQVFVLRET